MKVLIIGATGMLAKPVIRHLEKQGHELRLFSRTINSSEPGGKHEIVSGDLFNAADLQKAVSRCDAVHINLSKVNEYEAVRNITTAAGQKGIKLISYISGCTVSEENRWFPMIDNKFRAEQTIMNSGIPYIIVRPTWFFESLDLMVRNGKAMIIGKQPIPWRWIAADDYGRMLANAYRTPQALNRTLNIYGDRPFTMKEVLVKYCRLLYPDIKVSSAPVFLLKTIAALSGKMELKQVVSMFAYFEKVKEPGNADATNALLGKPEITFDKWLSAKKLVAQTV